MIKQKILVVFDTLHLKIGATYETTITLLNESVTPAKDITVEVVAEANDHQFYYTSTANGITIVTTDKDGHHQLEFYTSDISGEYKIVVEGIAKDGSVGSATTTFTVKEVNH